MTCIDNSLTRGNKAEISEWSMADFSAGVNMTQPYTAPSAGYVYIQSHEQAATWSGAISVNGNGVFYQTTGNSNTQSWGSAFIPVSKGDIITWVYNRGTDKNIFYPLKGA